MKGVFLQQQLEFALEVNSEFHQGDNLSCKLTIKNHSSDSQELKFLALHLVTGDLKKVKQKVAGAFIPISSAELPTDVTIANGEKKEFLWDVQLDRNCVVTDKAQTIFFLFGNSANLDVLGQLPLNIEPHPDVLEILSVFESELQFVVKGKKTSKNWTNIKISPSSAAKYTMLEQLTLSTHFEGDNLELKYTFDMKKFEATSSTLGVGKTKNTTQQTLSPQDYKKSGFIEHAIILNYINQALEAVGL